MPHIFAIKHLNYCLLFVTSSDKMSTVGLLTTNRKAIREAFGKSEKDVLKDVEIIRRWMENQLHLPEVAGDHMIESFLITNKFSIERTKQKLDMYYTIRPLIPEIFKNKNPSLPHMQEMFDITYYCPLPQLTKELYRVIVVKIRGDPEVFHTYNFIAHQLTITEVRLHEDVTLGDLYIIDYAHLKMGHVVKMTPMHLKKATTIMEKVFSNRLKGFHLINYPPYVEILMNISKTVLSPKLMSRTHLHNSPDELFEHFSKEMLPKDYGGDGLSLQELNDLWKLKVEEYKERFDKLDEIKVNEDLRPAPLKNDDVLGYHGNFKRLDVD